MDNVEHLRSAARKEEHDRERRFQRWVEVIVLSTAVAANVVIIVGVCRAWW